MADFADIEIRILGLEEQGYPVEVTLNNEREFKRSYLDPIDNLFLPTNLLDAESQQLTSWFFADRVLYGIWSELRGAYDRRRIRLRIDADAPELHRIPWELIRDPIDETLLATSNKTPYSRYLAGPWLPGKAIQRRPIKILVVIANPLNLASDYNLEPIDVFQELEALHQSTAGLDVALTLFPPSESVPKGSREDDQIGAFSTAPRPCTLEGLEAELDQGYHILHFIGHGLYSQRKGYAVLCLADPDNQVKLEKDSEIADMLADHLTSDRIAEDNRLRLIFLASCQTATRNPADAFRGLGPLLVKAGVPAVVAMQDLITIDGARQLTGNFYQDLMKHGFVDQALNRARNAIYSQENRDWAAPVLFMRLKTGQLFESKTAEVAAEIPPVVTAKQKASVPSSNRWTAGGGMTGSGEIDTVALHKEMAQAFSVSDLENLCFKLGIDFEEVGGSGKSGKAREIILYCQRRGMLEALVDACQEERPNIAWGALVGQETAPVPQPAEKASASGQVFRTQPAVSRTPDKEPAGERLKVFLCHSSGDKDAVRGLYQALEADGYDAWLDEEDILPGQEWDSVIKKALKTSDVILICLSQAAIEKEGYVQREVRLALDRAQEMVPGSIFVIPARLEACDLPDWLASYQAVDLYREGGYERLKLALAARAGQLAQRR